MPGQANYAAANTFIDAFVQFQHQPGQLPASVVDVGAVEGIGWNSDNPKVLERSGWLEGAILKQRELFQATTVAAFAPHPASTSDDSSSYQGCSAALHRRAAGKPRQNNPSTSTFIATDITMWVFDLLLKPIEDGGEVDLARSFVDIGFDSLAAVELRTRWKAVLGLDISVLEIMSFANLAASGDFAVQGLKAT
ncbi:KR-domain-containing protein [Triangularia verruculosa]|uniref:KR-domain-containing protein n=1 Tax=Triangularia verruculosa TaxID=2587418 RepID=A0AAN6XUS6_9PEZI|nr:KR-domain-containing protein [Triangularia verruculosa]